MWREPKSYIRHKCDCRVNLPQAPMVPPVDPAAPEARPLYAQVRTLLLQRLIEGIWKPGTALPSEMQLAQELGVSQGTVRKALDDLAAENLVVRRQGSGTFVPRQDRKGGGREKKVHIRLEHWGN